VALFIGVWIAAVAYWHLGNVEQRWTTKLGGAPGRQQT